MSVKLTRGGVTYNLEASPYYYTVSYEDSTTITYMFSSDFYKKKFIDKIEENRETINLSLTKRFGIDINFSKLCDIKLYSLIEKRGFLIKTNESIKCLNTIKLSGETLIIKS